VGETVLVVLLWVAAVGETVLVVVVWVAAGGETVLVVVVWVAAGDETVASATVGATGDGPSSGVGTASVLAAALTGVADRTPRNATTRHASPRTTARITRVRDVVGLMSGSPVAAHHGTSFLGPGTATALRWTTVSDP